EAWSVPVMVSPKAKGIFREDNPLFLGTIEGLGTAYLYDYIDTCDLVLMVGFDPVEFDRDWTARARIVDIGVVPNDDRYYGSEVEVVGPIDAALEQLSRDPQPRLTPDEVRAFRDGFAMSMAELETGVRLGLGVMVVVLVDDALSQIRAGQERKSYPVVGTTFGAIDYTMLGAAFGIQAKVVATAAECRDAFRALPKD